MKHSKEYYKRRQDQLDRRHEKVSADIENLLIELHEKQELLIFLESVQRHLETKMQLLDYDHEIDSFLDSIIPKVWYK